MESRRKRVRSAVSELAVGLDTSIDDCLVCKRVFRSFSFGGKTLLFFFFERSPYREEIILGHKDLISVYIFRRMRISLIDLTNYKITNNSKVSSTFQFPPELWK